MNNPCQSYSDEDCFLCRMTFELLPPIPAAGRADVSF